ncbi:hypothetical protein BJV74DRAFT_799744 [Russula compacta]|nr:hypothetical protein BJV74DRAFT_799744 [Russula compacta]
MPYGDVVHANGSATCGALNVREQLSSASIPQTLMDMMGLPYYPIDTVSSWRTKACPAKVVDHADDDDDSHGGILFGWDAPRQTAFCHARWESKKWWDPVDIGSTVVSVETDETDKTDKTDETDKTRKMGKRNWDSGESSLATEFLLYPYGRRGFYIQKSGIKIRGTPDTGTTIPLQ